MTDTDRLAALLIEVFPAANRNQWPFAAMDVAASLAAAGVTVAPTIDQLRAAASFHVEDNGHSPIGCVVCEYRLALGVTVAAQPADDEHRYVEVVDADGDDWYGCICGCYLAHPAPDALTELGCNPDCI